MQVYAHALSKLEARFDGMFVCSALRDRGSPAYVVRIRITFNILVPIVPRARAGGSPKGQLNGSSAFLSATSSRRSFSLEGQLKVLDEARGLRIALSSHPWVDRSCR